MHLHIIIGGYEFLELILRLFNGQMLTKPRTFDVGVYLLPQMTGWVLGKSGLKAIQYMAFGLPTVATDVGTTPRIIQQHENGWLVKTEME